MTDHSPLSLPSPAPSQRAMESRHSGEEGRVRAVIFRLMNRTPRLQSTPDTAPRGGPASQTRVFRIHPEISVQAAWVGVFFLLKNIMEIRQLCYSVIYFQLPVYEVNGRTIMMEPLAGSGSLSRWENAATPHIKTATLLAAVGSRPTADELPPIIDH